jgi:hypothetical protein
MMVVEDYPYTDNLDGVVYLFYSYVEQLKLSEMFFFYGQVFPVEVSKLMETC